MAYLIQATLTVRTNKRRKKYITDIQEDRPINCVTKRTMHGATRLQKWRT